MRGNSKIGKVIKYLISMAVALVLLYFSFRGVKWADFMESLKNCELGYIFISMAAGIMAFWLRGIRWRQLLLPLDGSISRLTAFNAYNIGYLANFVFPRIGEFVRCGVITKNSAREDGPAGNAETGAGPAAGAGFSAGPKAGSDAGPEAGLSAAAGAGRKASYDKVLGTVVLERSWDMVTMLLLLFLLLAFKWNEFGSFFIEKIWVPMQQRLDFNLWWIVIILIAVFIAAIWGIIATKEKFPISKKIYGICIGIMRGISCCLKMKHKWLFFLYTILIWLMYWTMSYAAMHAVPELSGLAPQDAMFLMLAGSFGWLVPVPGGFGAFHFIVSIALTTVYSIPFELGIIFATISHESQAITMVLCGGISYIYEFFLHPSARK